jgi:hypothetical protein
MRILPAAAKHTPGNEHTYKKTLSAQKLYPLPVGAITARGWLKAQLRREADGMSGRMDELEPAMLAKPFVTRGRNKKISVGWNAEISGEYWCGLVNLAFTLDDRKLKRKAERWVNGVLAAQEEDGYIGAYRKTDDRTEDYNPWSVHFAVRALLSYHEATGRADVLEACRRGLLWFVDHWANHRTDYAGPTIIESCAVVYGKTGEKRLLVWAEKYLAWLEKNSRWPNHLPAMAGPELAYNSAHAVAYGVWIDLPAALFCATGRKEYLAAAKNAMRKVIQKCFQETGAPASNHEYLSPPGALSETEYCNFPVYAEALRWLLKASGAAEYGDRIERIVFNGSQGAKKKDGRAIAYMSSPNQQLATLQSSNYGPRGSMEVYAPVYEVACCPAMSVRVLPEFTAGLVMTDGGDGIYVTGYAPCRAQVATAAGTSILEVETEYPFREDVTLRLTPAAPGAFTLHLRIPRWCKKPLVSVNRKKIGGPIKPGSFFAISRTWRAGDIVQMRFPMELRVVEVDDRAIRHERPLAIERGPLLFALPIEPLWKEVAGNPLTPLPSGWCWYEAEPRHNNYFNDRPWSVVLDWRRLKAKRAMRAAYRDIGLPVGDQPRGSPRARAACSAGIHALPHQEHRNVRREAKRCGPGTDDRTGAVRLH